jgi:hypothetical protein
MLLKASRDESAVDIIAHTAARHNTSMLSDIQLLV